MKDPIKISVLGVAGRMGRMILKAITENNQTSIVGATEHEGHKWIGQDIGKLMLGKENGILVSNKPHDVIMQSQAIIDFTKPEVKNFEIGTIVLGSDLNTEESILSSILV